MKLKSMKLAAGQRDKLAAPSMAEGSDRPLYPWGLEVRLDTDALEKLGLKDHLPAVGATMKLEARVDVVSVSEHDSASGKSCDVSLQITDLALGKPSKDADELADGLYGKGGKS